MSAPDEARAIVMARIRTALSVATLDRARRASVARRLERHPRGTIPAQAVQSPAGCIARLGEMLTKQGAEVARVATPEDAVHAIASYLSSNNLPPRLRMGTDLRLAALPWREAWDISRVFGRAELADKACLSRALVAAETGTLFLASGAENPTTLNFLPEIHMVLLRTSDIVGSYEEAWDRLRGVYGERSLPPRTVNLISGPSRTADIEQTIVRGAHGPRRLFVLILA